MNRVKFIFLILSVALFLRLGFIFGTKSYIHPETVEAGVIAHALISGKGFSLATPGSQEYHPTAIQAPVFPLVLAGLYSLFGENDLAYLTLAILQTLLSIWLCYLIYCIGTLVLDKKTGLLAMGFAAFYPIFIIYSGRITNTMISIVTVAWFIYLFLKFILCKESSRSRNTFGNGVLLGVSAGLAILAEPIMLGFIILCFAGYIFIKIQNKTFHFLFIAILVAAAVVLPWTIRNYLVFQNFIPVRTMFGINLWQGNNPEATGTDMLPNGRPMYDRLPPEYADSKIPEPERDAIMLQLAKEYIVSHPGTAFSLFLKKCYYFWWFPPKEIVSHTAAQYAKFMRIPYLLLLLLAFIGTGITLREKRYAMVSLFWLLFFTYMFVYGITHFGHFRYRAPIEPYLLILAAYGLIYLIDKIRVYSKPVPGQVQEY